MPSIEMRKTMSRVFGRKKSKFQFQTCRFELYINYISIFKKICNWIQKSEIQERSFKLEILMCKLSLSRSIELFAMM